MCAFTWSIETSCLIGSHKKNSFILKMLQTEKELPKDEISELQQPKGKMLEKFQGGAVKEEAKKQKLDLSTVFVGIKAGKKKQRKKKKKK